MSTWTSDSSTSSFPAQTVGVHVPVVIAPIHPIIGQSASSLPPVSHSKNNNDDILPPTQENLQKKITDYLENQCDVVLSKIGLKTWLCRSCGQVCPSQSSFVMHYRTHTGEKPFGCPHCPYRGNQKIHLLNHLKCKHKI